MGEDPDLQRRFNFLMRAALADSKHDFHEKYPKYFNLDSVHNDSKPGFPEVLLGLDQSKPDSIPNKIESEDTIIKLVIPYLTQFKDIHKFKMELKKDKSKTLEIHGYNRYNYTTKILSNGGNFDTNQMNDLTLHDFNEFFQSKVLNLLIDASSLGIRELISKLKSDPANDIDFTINSLINRETVNDPADKITEFYPKKASDKLHTHILIDREPYDIVYTHNTEKLNDIHLQRDKFFSVFDFKMSPVLYKQQQKDNILKYPTINVDILQKDGKRIYYVNDPKDSNTITGCWDLIKSCFKTDRLKAAVHFQSKRSGDWLQALSCLDRSRNYGNPLTGHIKHIEGEITLVTHDIVFLAYALFIGIDVIFTHFSDGEHSLLYFRNENHPNREAKETRDTRIKKEAKNYIDETLNKHIEFMDTYDRWIKDIIEIQTDIIQKTLEKPNSSKNPNYFKQLWRLLSLKYNSFDKTKKEIEALKSDVEDERDITTDKYLLACERILSYKSILDIRSLETEKEVKKFFKKSMNASSNDRFYKYMVSPTTLMRGTRGGANITELVIRMVGAFRSRLPPDLFKHFVHTCIQWQKLYKDDDFAIHTIVGLVKDDISFELDDNSVELEALLSIVNITVNNDMSEEDGEVVDEGEPIDEDKPIEPLEDDKPLEPLEEGEIVDIISIFGSDVSHLTERIYSYLTRMEGGRMNREIHLSDTVECNSILYSLLINVYLKRLYFIFNDIDSESNFDFKYYKELILWIHTLFSKEKSPEGRAYILYTHLPSMDGMIGFLAKQMFVHSLGLWSEQIHVVGMLRTDITGINIISLNKALDFNESKTALSKMISNEFETAEIVDDRSITGDEPQVNEEVVNDPMEHKSKNKGTPKKSKKKMHANNNNSNSNNNSNNTGTRKKPRTNNFLFTPEKGIKAISHVGSSHSYTRRKSLKSSKTLTQTITQSLLRVKSNKSSRSITALAKKISKSISVSKSQSRKTLSSILAKSLQSLKINKKSQSVLVGSLLNKIGEIRGSQRKSLKPLPVIPEDEEIHTPER